MVMIFNDRRPFYSLEDERFSELKASLSWFDEWRLAIKTLAVPAETKKQMFISQKCFFDISSMIIGFRELCRISFSKHPGCRVFAWRMNSDLVENIFCQERGCNGQSTNPTVQRYSKLTYNQNYFKG